MNVSIDGPYQDFIRACVASGKFTDEVQVVNAALALFEERERLLAAIDAGTADLDEGRYTDYQSGDFQRFWQDICDEEQRMRGDASNS
jgi:Arc/MetJ-type ribon-helix-helix transcriptional regulator